MLEINNPGWWLTALLNFLGYFIYGFGSISEGNAKEIIKFVGVILVVLSFILMFIFFGIGSGIGLIVFAFIIVAPITGFLTAGIERRLYGNIRRWRKMAEISKLRKYGDKSDLEVLKEVIPGIMSGEEQYKKRHQEMLDRMRKGNNET